ncbi:MAG: hypothetical protein IT548_17865 [Alphaproteobacteria bacterium]|nr:hypothetical protein [Alphaproteobacteria bacterium]
MTQLSLFQKPAPAPLPPDLDFIRKHLKALLRLAKAAELMPWGPAEASKWERFFPELTRQLPPEEGAKLREAFAREMDRLRSRP